MKPKPDAVVLFSGGLDSLLAAKLMVAQGLSVLCAHFFSPFFGRDKPSRIWADEYGLEALTVDLSIDFAKMMATGPAYGYGKHLNPCIDCKILQLSKARDIMENVGARFLVTGEVPGQRPMSQRKDTLNLIQREAGVRDLVLRPLSARLLPPVAAEREGLVDRERLLSISGRGRTPQYELAEKFGLRTIPSPAGGCALTEAESSRRYWMIFEDYRRRGKDDPAALSRDLRLANIGRFVCRKDENVLYWAMIGRNSGDNQRLADALEAGDLLLRMARFPGPITLCRRGKTWPRAILESLAAHMAVYATRAVAAGGAATIRCYGQDFHEFFPVIPGKDPAWGLPQWEEIRKEIRGK
ncbi:MAG: tRNA(5-methylaminomethyl-2-thiouridylate) methyltransferase [Desulfovibrio sp.]|nr:tRNA(5-methylaminomethyl-2-thiouridylate) methyltransferase [Desulfovibrio sp.]